MSRRKTPSIQIVVLEWHDACYNAGQYRPDEFEPVCLLRSAGVLVKETATHLSFSQDFYPVEGTYRHITSVPKGMIVSLQPDPSGRRRGGGTRLSGRVRIETVYLADRAGPNCMRPL